MGWRKTLGVEQKSEKSKPIRNMSTIRKSPTKEVKNYPFAPIAHIAHRNEKLNFNIPKMAKCLHGLPCSSILVKDDRQICRVNGQPIFDLEVCPMKKPKWFVAKQITNEVEL